jgi:hypothetical protein
MHLTKGMVKMGKNTLGKWSFWSLNMSRGVIIVSECILKLKIIPYRFFLVISLIKTHWTNIRHIRGPNKLTKDTFKDVFVTLKHSRTIVVTLYVTYSRTKTLVYSNTRNTWRVLHQFASQHLLHRGRTHDSTSQIFLNQTC